MDFRTRRQLAILAIVALVAGGIGFLVIRASLPAPSCQDNRRNQREEGIDCGGPCTSCVLRQSKPVEIFWTRFVQVRENTYDVAAEIRNPNVRLGAVSFAYEFKLYDAAGANVASRRGTAYLYPGETMHLIEVGLLSGRSIANAVLTVSEVAWVLSDTAGPDLIAGSKEYTLIGDPGSVTSAVKAIVSNRGLKDLADITVSALVFDRDGNLLGVHRTALAALAAGAAQPVTLTWPRAFAVAPSSLTVEARSPAELGKFRP
ncbi:MAG: hypothetical protein Q8R35_00140 [bacterium]|nr:hypothetical protein [bacterium]